MLETIAYIRPEEIERRSMEIIREGLGDGCPWREPELSVVMRCIHTSADFDYGQNLYFSPGAVQKGIEALRRGASVVTDTQMAYAGVNKQRLAQYGGQAFCFMGDEDVRLEAARRGVTRAAVCMERGATLAGEVIFAVGNAPTALIRLRELIGQGLRPALVIGVPVGFVNVEEAKELIIGAGVPCIVARGRKGGSSVAAAVLNAMLYAKEEGKDVAE